MKSIIKNKKAFEMGWVEIMYLILGLLIIFFIVSSLFGVNWGAIVKGWLPKLNTTTSNDYSLIEGTDESVTGVNADAVVARELAIKQEGVDYARLAADVCSYLGFGGMMGVDYSAAFHQDLFSGNMGQIESVNLAPGVLGAEIVNSAGQVVGNLVRASEGGYKLTYVASGVSRTATLATSGEIIVGGNRVGYISKDVLLKFLIKGGTSITTKTGKDAIIAVNANKVPQLVTKSSRAFSFLSKTATGAGYVTATVSAACDIAAMVLATTNLVQDQIALSKSAAKADESIKNNVDSIKTNFDKINSLYSPIESSEYISTLDKQKILNAITDLSRTEVSIEFLYSESTKREFKYLYLAGKSVSNEEYKSIKIEIENYRAQLVKLRSLLEGISLVSPPAESESIIIFS